MPSSNPEKLALSRALSRTAIPILTLANYRSRYAAAHEEHARSVIADALRSLGYTKEDASHEAARHSGAPKERLESVLGRLLS